MERMASMSSTDRMLQTKPGKGLPSLEIVPRNYENEACLTLWILFSLLIFGWRVWQKVQGL